MSVLNYTVTSNDIHLVFRYNGARDVIPMILTFPSNIFMNDLMLFTDGSVDTHSKIGYGAHLAVSERNDYCSKRNKRLLNYELYREFYRMTDQLDCEFVQVR